MASMMLGDQLLVGKIASVDDPLHGVMEDLRVVPVVETPFQFFEVAVQMLDADLVERSDNRTLEQRPYALDPVGVNVPDHPLFGGVADGFMSCIGVSDPDVGLQLVSVNCLGLVLDVAPDEVMEGMAPDVGDALDPDLPGVALDGSAHPGLAFLASRSDIAFLPADQSFVHFNDTEQGGSNKGIVAHGLSDAVAQIPGGVFGADTQGGLKLPGGDAFLGDAHEVDGGKPLAKRQVGVVHDGPGDHGKVVFAPLAIPLAAVLDPSDVHISAPGTGDPAGPAQLLQVSSARIIRFETIQKGDKVHGSSS